MIKFAGTVPISSLPQCAVEWGIGNSDYEGVFSFIIFGASGNLAINKTYPALFSLFPEYLPQSTILYGYSRTKMTSEEFRAKIKPMLNPCKSEERQKFVQSFLNLCEYVSGEYDPGKSGYGELNKIIMDSEEKRLKCVKKKTDKKNRLFYYAIPPSLFGEVSHGIRQFCCGNEGWNRIIIEKPFGKDYDSSLALGNDLLSLFTEEQIYRIDHYLGKEMVQNIMITRFANFMYEPIWNNNYIQCVKIVFKEPIGTEGRGGYFDQYGIIRDVMQNHLMQVLSLIAMEPPASLESEDIRNEKVKVLKSVKIPEGRSCVLGQYIKTGDKPGYLDDPQVPKDSKTPTYASLILNINNRRWAGVPFLLKCGKALEARKAEIRIQFKDIPGTIFPGADRNELVIRVQPDEAMYMKMNMKKPGLTTQEVGAELDITLKNRYKNSRLPEAYERLILDVIRGDHSHFVRFDELQQSWKIFTPLLKKIDAGEIPLYQYDWGSRGPKEGDELANQIGYVQSKNYQWTK